MSKEPPNFRRVVYDSCVKCKWCGYYILGCSVCVKNYNYPISNDFPTKWICDDFEKDEDE